MTTLSFRQTRLNNAALAAYHLLKRIGVPVTLSGVEAAWERSQEAGSLYAIGRQLYQWRVPYLCLQAEVSGLDQLPLPFIAHVSQAPHFIVITGVDQERIIYVDHLGEEKRMARARFLEGWAGHVLLAERSSHSGETGFQQNRQRERRRFLLPIAVGLFIVLALVTLHTPGLAVLLLIKTAGMAVSALLLLAQLDARHPLAAAFCTRGRGCTDVLQSARHLTLLSWSEAGLLYFLVGFIYLLFRPATLLPLAALDALALLFIPYSLYVQKFVAKAWCRLCLTVLLLVALQPAAYLFLRPWHEPLVVTVVDGLWLSMTALLSGLLLVLIKTAVGKSLEAGRYRRGYHRLKYDPSVFDAVLRQQKKVRVPEGLGLTIGNPSAARQIVQVCHPYCRPCGRAHRLIEALQSEKDDLCVRILFNVSADDDASALPVLRFLALQKLRPTLLPQALADWYAGVYYSYELFAKRYAVAPDEQDREGLGLMDEWCTTNGIGFTPTIFVNGRQLPAQYDVSDLPLLFDE